MVRAVLAGGLVLGVGAAVTLAAWNDETFVSGTFTAGQFNLQGTIDDSTWDENATSPGGALSFSVSPTNLSPGATITAPFAVRLDSTTTSGATVTVTLASTSGTVTNLTYTLQRMDSWGCGGTVDETLVSDASIATGAAGSFSLTAPPDAGSVQNLCFTVTGGAGLVQGQSGGAVWEFAAASV